MEKTRPGLVKEIEDAVEVVAGGMHSVVLNKLGRAGHLNAMTRVA